MLLNFNTSCSSEIIKRWPNLTVEKLYHDLEGKLGRVDYFVIVINTVKKTKQDGLNTINEIRQESLRLNETAFEHVFKYMKNAYNIMFPFTKCKWIVEDEKEENKQQLE